MRLDLLLVSRGLCSSRSRARDAIRRGAVRVGGVVAAKPGQEVGEAAEVELSDPAQDYVSRAALKLIHALDMFGISPAGLHALDLGASTGGFTQVLLERGARQVTAVDVGHGQLVSQLASDARVTLHEGLNARDLTRAHLATPPGLVVADVSFISLKLALPPALALTAPGARLIALVKPQFEAGPAALDRSGVIRDPEVRDAVCQEMRRFVAEDQGWAVIGLVASPILGGEGNEEYLLAAQKP